MDYLLQNHIPQVIIDTEDDLLRQPLMNIEEISSEVVDLINDDPYEEECNFITSGTLICDDDEHDDNVFFSPRPIDPYKLQVVNKVPLRHSLLNDNIVSDLIADLADVARDDKIDHFSKKDMAFFPLQQPLPISEVQEDDFLFNVPPPPPALITPTTSSCSIPEAHATLFGTTQDDNKRKFEDDYNTYTPVEVPSKKLKIEEVSTGSFLDMLQAKLDEFRNNQRLANACLSNTDVIIEKADKIDNKNDTSTIDFEDESSDTYRFRPYQYEQWQERFDELCEFKKVHGHCNVPRKEKATVLLWRWVKRQKYQYKLFKEGKQSTLSQERISALENVGVTWDFHGSTWSERLSELTTYRQVNGHCNVPSKYPANPQLSTWVKCQRRQYKLYQSGKSSNITAERIEKLAQLDFVFEPRAKKTV